VRTWQQEETQLKKRSAGNSAFARPSQGRPDDAEDDLAVMEDLGSSSAQVRPVERLQSLAARLVSLFSTGSSLLHSRYQITSMLILFTQQAPSKAQNVKGTGKQTQLTFSQVHS
jgi:hypothetical protein